MRIKKMAVLSYSLPDGGYEHIKIAINAGKGS